MEFEKKPKKLFDYRKMYRMPWNLPDNVAAWLEVTTKCNLYCKGCYRENTDHHKTLEEISLEIRTGTGIDDDTVRGIDLELESLYGVYGLYHYSISELASLYGAVGISRASLKASVSGSSDQDNDHGLSYGVGVKFSIFSVEFMRYLDTNEIEVDAITVGVHYTLQ